MAEGGFPNRNRADNALTIYRDAMREYLAPILERKHGPNWIRSQVLNDDLRERNPGSYERRLQSLRAGTAARNLIDLADIPFLLRNNSDVFSGLRPADIQRTHQIRDLRNEIQHPDRSGDCEPREADAITDLCARVLDRCGLSAAVDNVRGLPASIGTTGSSEARSRKERERREWDKARLAGKSPEELTPWDQERLANIEWEEEWEQREQERLAQLEREQQREREKQQRQERKEQERHERELKQQRERRKLELEQQYERALQKRLKREKAEIAALSDDIDGLRRWFDKYIDPRKFHSPEYEVLLRRERERLEREQGEIVAFGDDLDGLRRWFDADANRRQRHPSERAVLEQRERHAIAAFGDDIGGLRRWFDESPGRLGRHRSAYQALGQRELVQRERAELAVFGNDIDGLRRWFDSDRTRRPRHSSEYEELTRVVSHWRYRLRARLLAAVGSVIAFVRDLFSIQRLRRDARRLPRLLGSLILSLRPRRVLLLAGSYLLLYSIGVVAGWSGFGALIIWTVLLFCWFSAKRLGRSDPVHKRTK